jgi:gamma-glutamyltranspeptidase/glutathione hydrolase
MLNILEGYDLASMEPGSAEAIHLMVEAKRLAFEDRAAFYADPAFSPPPEGLFSKAYAAERREFISRDEAMTSVGAGDPAALEAGDTTYLVVADKDGMMVSLIQSNYRGMGTGLVPDGLGFMLQDRGQLFSLEEGHPNEYEPGKRPFHTIIPAFVTKGGEPWMAFGLMGGAMQPQGHVQILVNMIDWGMNVQAAGDAARWRHVGSSSIVGDNPPDGVGTIRVESGIARSERTELQVMGHTVEAARSGFGGYQAIRVLDNGVYAAATERRKDGSAGGY